MIPPFAEQPTEQVVVGGSGPLTTGNTAGVQIGTATAELGATTTGTSTTPPQSIQAISIAGNVPLESWTEIFRCFINPTAKLGLKSLLLGINFRLTAHDGQPLPADHPAVKGMREAANQLGLNFEAK